MKLKKITVFSLLLTALCGCTTQPSNDTNNMLETKTYLYSYDYETEPNGELSTAYHEEKPSVDLNEPRDVVRATVNFKKNAVTYIKMNEKYSFGSCECAITQAYVTSDSNYFYTLVNENYLKLQGSYLFAEIAHRVQKFKAENPEAEVISLGIGDVTLPLPQVSIEAMHKAVDEMAQIISHQINESLNIKTQVKYLSEKSENRKPGICMDNNKLKQLGWNIQYSIEQGIKETINYYLNN